MTKLHWNENHKEQNKHQADVLEREVEERNEQEYVSAQIGKLDIANLDEYGVHVKLYTSAGTTNWMLLTPELAQRIMFIAQSEE